MESEKNSKDQPKDDKRASADAMFFELNRSLKSLAWMTHFTVFYFKFMRKAVKVLENLFIASWFGLILIGIWSENTMYYKIAFTILVAGGILAFVGKALIELFKKSKPAEKKPPLSDSAMNMAVMSILMDKLKNDEGYRKEVAKKFYDDLMAKKFERAEGEQEPKE